MADLDREAHRELKAVPLSGISRAGAAAVALPLSDNFPMLLPHRNSIFVPASELHISIYADSETTLDFTSPGLDCILETLNFRTRAGRRAKMPAAFVIAARQAFPPRRIPPAARQETAAHRRERDVPADADDHS
jgi:hypothetical protein